MIFAYALWNSMFSGNISGNEIIWLGESASEGVYKKMTFSKYKRMKRRQQRESG